ncbi:MAG: hypothetical protein WCX48_00295 [Bacteroidales bacterium]
MKNILLMGFLALTSGTLLLNSFLNGINEESDRFDHVPYSALSSQYSFSSSGGSFGEGCAILNSGYDSNTLQARLTPGSFLTACLLEKILFYSSNREKYLSKVTTKPFPKYLIHFLDSPGGYYVYSLRKIVI